MNWCISLTWITSVHKHRQFVKSVALLWQILKLGLIFIRAINFESVISYSRCKSVADRGLDDIARATEQRSCEPCCRMKISMCRKPGSPNDRLQRNPFLLICHFHVNSENATRCKLCAFFSGVKLCLINPKWREASQKYQLSVAINVVLVKPTTHSFKALNSTEKRNFETCCTCAAGQSPNHNFLCFWRA